MARTRPLHTLTPQEFDAAMAALGLPASACARGSQNFLASADGRMRAWAGLALQGGGVQGGHIMVPASEGYASLGSVGSPGSGNVAAHIADSLWYAGGGPLRFNGSPVGALSASSTLSFVLRSGGSYGATAYQAGRVAPSAPAITARDNVGGRIDGGTAIRVTRINPTTGGESDASDPTLPVVVTAGKLVISFAGITLDANGQLSWGLYAPRIGFQTKGPFYGLAKYPEVTDASLATLYGILRAVEVDFTDAELDYERVAPIDNDPPAACGFVAALENIVLAINVYRNGVVGSKPGYPEAFPVPDNLAFLPGPAVAVYPRVTSFDTGRSFVLIAGRNFLYAAVYTGQTPPFALQSILPETGIAAHHNLCFAGNEIYLFAGARGICRVRAAGSPDYEFARPVAEYTSAWVPENVVAGEDGDTQQVVFAHGSEMLAYNRATGRWSAPLKLSALRSAGAAAPLAGTIKSCVTKNNKLYLAVDTGVALALYRFSEGGSGSRAIYQSPWMPAEGAQENIRRVKLHLEGSMNRAATLQIFANGDDTAVLETFNIAAQAGGSRLRHIKTLKPNARNCESYALRLTLDSDDGSESLIAALTAGYASGVPL